MGLEDIVKKAAKAPVKAAKGLYESVIKPAAGYVKNVILGYFPHTIRTMIGGNDYTGRLIPDQQHTFKRNLQFDVIKDLIGLTLGYSLLAGGLGIAGAVLAGASLIDLVQNGIRYVTNKASNGNLRPAPLWTELSTPWIWLSAGHGVYHVTKYGTKPHPVGS